MSRTEEEVLDVLRAIYRENFGGKTNQRFLISWADLRAIYGFDKLFDTRFEALAECGVERGLYLFDLGEGQSGHHVAVLKVRTVDRWRKLPRTVARQYLPPPPDADPADEEDEDD